MTQPEKSDYLEQLRLARGRLDGELPEIEASHERERALYGREADLWSDLMEQAIRALGAGADVLEVYELVTGHPLKTWSQVNDWERLMSSHVRHWIYRSLRATGWQG